jgi:3-phosphoshikimate 1-carboxyvinyltransferase
MTLGIMQSFGASVDEDDQTYRVKPQAYKCTEYTIEGDVSSASYFFAIAALTGSTLTVKNLNPQSQQADMGFLRILQTMGLTSSPGDKAITFQGTGVRAVSFDMRDCPDQAQTLAVLAAFVDGATTIAGIQSLRIKETERIKALQQELVKMGIKTEATPDSLTIYGGEPRPASIATYDDHRMAMAFAVAGTKLKGMEIQEPDVVTKTFPDFWKELASIGVKLKEVKTS